MNYKNEEWLRKQYWDNQLNCDEIGILCSVKGCTINKWMKVLDVKRRSNQEAQLLNVKTKKYINKEWLRREYIDNKQCCDDIAKDCNCSGTTIRNALIRFGIKIRTRSESQKGIPKPWKEGRIVTEETRKKLSKALKGKNTIGHKHTEETKRKMSQTRKGMKQTPEWIEKRTSQLRSENHPSWKGDLAKATAIHDYIRRKKPKLDICEICDKKKKVELSFNHLKGKHTRNIEDYRWLCRKCHMAYDKEIGIRNMSSYARHHRGDVK